MSAYKNIQCNLGHENEGEFINFMIEEVHYSKSFIEKNIINSYATNG
ncbi:hypothetical protein OAO18_04085 [Francisellaceae bacterium]|nr:hypothetical protein [Francisellaceae bacterium]